VVLYEGAVSDCKASCGAGEKQCGAEQGSKQVKDRTYEKDISFLTSDHEWGRYEIGSCYQVSTACATLHDNSVVTVFCCKSAYFFGQPVCIGCSLKR
jgi:hypothetical protein